MTETVTDAFFGAIKAGDVATVKSIVSADPSLVNATAKTGESAVLTAVYHHHKEIADLLVARGAKLSLFEACAAGELEHVERLLESEGVAVNAHSPDGWTPLHLAAFFGHVKVAETLLSHRADVTARSTNSNGNTPLHAALAANRKLVAGLLLGHGADVNAADAEGWRPLHLATFNNNLDSMKALIAQGANVTLGKTDGTTPLAMAVEKGHREAEALLRRHGA
jgi:ankyrin repeat protein